MSIDGGGTPVIQQDIPFTVSVSQALPVYGNSALYQSFTPTRASIASNSNSLQQQTNDIPLINKPRGLADDIFLNTTQTIKKTEPTTNQQIVEEKENNSKQRQESIKLDRENTFDKNILEVYNYVQNQQSRSSGFVFLLINLFLIMLLTYLTRPEKKK